MIGRLVLMLAMALPALYLACSSDSDNGSSASPSAVASASFSPRGTFAPGETKTATPSPPPPSAGETPGPPPAPAFSSGVSKTAEGVLGFTLLPGVKNSFDPIVFPADPGLQQPPCPQFVFAFGWTVTDPYPPDNVSLTWRLNRQGQSVVDIGSGPTGSQTVGCGAIEAINNSPVNVTVSIHYLTGATGQ